MGATHSAWNPLTWWRSFRAVRRLAAEQYAAIPAGLRPPPGEWLEASSNSGASWVVPLDGTLDRQDVLKAICEISGYEERPEQPIRGWLALHRDETDKVRFAVLVGTEVVGFLDESESFLHETKSGALRTRIERQERRGKVVWVDVFLDVENGRYAPGASIP